MEKRSAIQRTGALDGAPQKLSYYILYVSDAELAPMGNPYLFLELERVDNSWNNLLHQSMSLGCLGLAILTQDLEPRVEVLRKQPVA